jgi:hypothetical protein
VALVSELNQEIRLLGRLGHSGGCVLRTKALLLLLAISSVWLDVAWGNGDEFFRGDAFADDKPLDTQVIFSGSVKDQQGNYIEDATITVALTVTTPRGERQITFNAYTNNIGRFRTLDAATVVLVMEEVEVDVDPRQVELTVAKPGYEVVRRLDRSRRSQTRGVFEVDFTLQKAGPGI